eukprot:5725822-Alexandrium_andersonii.AAC.1
MISGLAGYHLDGASQVCLDTPFRSHFGTCEQLDPGWNPKARGATPAVATREHMMTATMRRQ